MFFKVWEINVEYFTLIAIDQYIDRLMIDGSVSWQKESFFSKADKEAVKKESIDMFDNVVRVGIQFRKHTDKGLHNIYKAEWNNIRMAIDKTQTIKSFIYKTTNNELRHRIITDYIRFLVKKDLQSMTCGSMNRESCIHYGSCNEKYCLTRDRNNICNYTFNRTKKYLRLHE